MFWDTMCGKFDVTVPKNHCLCETAASGKRILRYWVQRKSRTGDPAKKVGNEFLHQMQAFMNIQVLDGYESKK